MSRERGVVLRRLRAPAALLGLALLALWSMGGPAVLRAPLIPQERSVPDLYPGDGDPLCFLWNLWLTGRSLAQGRWPGRTDLLYPPAGVSLAGHTLSLLDGVLAWPLTATAGPRAGYMFALFAQSLLTGLGGWVLARKLGAEPLLAFWAGTYAMLFPARMAHAAEHLNLLSTGLVPWAAVAWLALERAGQPGGPGRGRAGAAALWFVLCLAATAAASLTLWAGALVLFGVVALGASWSDLRRASAARRRGVERSPARGAALRRAALLAAAVVAAAPFWFPLLRAWDLPPRAPSEAARFSMGLDALVLPDPGAALLGEVSRGLFARWGRHPLETRGAVTLGALGLLLLAWRRRGRGEPRRGPWALALLALLLLALGPGLTIGPWRTALPLPGALLLRLPGLSLSRAPGRWWLLAPVAIIILVAGRPRPQKRRAVRALCLVSLIELLPAPLPLSPLPSLPAELGEVESAGSWLDIPTHWKARRYLFQQISHGRPLVVGFLARIPADAFLRYETFPLLRELMDPPAGWEILLARRAGELADLIDAFDVRQVAVHGDLLRAPWSPERMEEALRLAGFRGRVVPGTPATVIVLERARTRIEPGDRFSYYPVAGWYGLELDQGAGFRWSRGRSSWIGWRDTRRGDAEPPGWELVMRGIAPGIRVEYAVDGRQAGAVSLGEEWTVLSIPSTAADPQQTWHRLRLTYNRTVTPRGDGRRLAVAIRELRRAAAPRP